MTSQGTDISRKLNCQTTDLWRIMGSERGTEDWRHKSDILIFTKTRKLYFWNSEHDINTQWSWHFFLFDCLNSTSTSQGYYRFSLRSSLLLNLRSYDLVVVGGSQPYLSSCRWVLSDIRQISISYFPGPVLVMCWCVSRRHTWINER